MKTTRARYRFGLDAMTMAVGVLMAVSTVAADGGRTAPAPSPSPIQTPASSASSTIDYDQLATRVVDDLLAVGFGVGRDEWRARVPAAEWRDRRGARESGWMGMRGPQPRGLWCATATDVTAGVQREAVFHGLRTERPYDCRLELVRVVMDDAAEFQRYFDALDRALTARVGEGYAASTMEARPQDGAGPERFTDKNGPRNRWDEIRLWSQDSRPLVLTRSGTAVQLSIQTNLLGFALATAEQLDPAFRHYGIDLWRWDVMNALRPIDPEAADLVRHVDYDTDQPRIEATLHRLLSTRPPASSTSPRAQDRRDMMTFAAALLVPGLWQEIITDSLTPPPLPRLAKYGIRFDLHGHGSGWRGRSGLADAVRKRRPGSQWGQLAFLARLSDGWTDTEGEGAEFRHVIREGTAWLRRYPKSPLAVPVMSCVARAYDTWWSLSRAVPVPEPDYDVDPEPFRKGAENARIQAIAWYERIIAAAPTSPEADQARRVLVLLHVKADTGERRYHMIYP